jgi:hypothetical protein
MSTKQSAKLLFEEAIEKCFVPPELRLQKLKTWIEQANNARNSGNLKPFQNQYDKAEELITFYTFAPLALNVNRVGLTNRILGLAGISAFEEEVVDIALERQYRPPTGYLRWIRKEVKNHPIRYIREQATLHKPNQPLESRTHVDAFIETDKLLIFFEIKYTSDISYSTTFNPCRNQLARLIDVGLDVNEHNGKEVLVILSTPRKLYEKRSRLYYYKVKEYTDPAKIKEDIEWRSVSEIKNNVLAVRWIALEDLIDALYKDFEHEDKKEALQFFKERNLGFQSIR